MVKKEIYVMSSSIANRNEIIGIRAT